LAAVVLTKRMAVTVALDAGTSTGTVTASLKKGIPIGAAS
jgi:hypothetical protein